MFLSGKSDPYVVIYTEGTRPQLTSTKYKTLDPNWNEKMTVEVKGADSVLHLVMFDHNDINQDEFMGELILPLSKMPLDRGASLDAWYTLEQPPSKRDDSVSGELRLVIRVSDMREAASRVKGAAPPLGAAQVAAAKERHERRDGKTLGFFDGSSEEIKPAEAHMPRLKMRVVEAEGVNPKMSRDSNGLADPFAIVFVGAGDPSKTSSWRTTTIAETLAPVWPDEAKESPVSSVDAVVHVLLFDHDGLMKSSDYLGEVIVPVSLLKDGRPHDHWLKLCSPAGHTPEATGRVRLDMQLLHHERFDRLTPSRKDGSAPRAVGAAASSSYASSSSYSRTGAAATATATAKPWQKTPAAATTTTAAAKPLQTQASTAAARTTTAAAPAYTRAGSTSAAGTAYPSVPTGTPVVKASDYASAFGQRGGGIQRSSGNLCGGTTAAAAPPATRATSRGWGGTI